MVFLYVHRALDEKFSVTRGAKGAHVWHFPTACIHHRVRCHPTTKNACSRPDFFRSLSRYAVGTKCNAAYAQGTWQCDVTNIGTSELIIRILWGVGFAMGPER